MSNAEKEDKKDRAQGVIHGAEKTGVKAFITPKGITDGNSKLNTAFCAAIFNKSHGLGDLNEQEKEDFEAAGLIDDDIEGTREERSFRMWINSLGLEDIHINNLYEEAKDGNVFLRVLDRVQPGIVDWKRVEKKVGNNQIKKQINCGVAIDYAVELGCKIPGIDATQINRGSKKAILAIVW